MGSRPSPAAARPVTSLSRALSLVHSHGATRRADLTEQLGLTRTATGLVLRELEELELVRSTAPDPPAGGGGVGPARGRASTTGRPSHAIAIHPDAPTVLAAHVQAETLLLAEGGLGGSLRDVAEIPLPRPATPAAVLAVAADELAARLHAGQRRRIGVGLAVPSAVTLDGIAQAALHLDWPAVPVGSMLAGLLDDRGHPGTAVHVGNDANLAALAESRHGAGHAAAQMLYLMTGQAGVGGGLVVDGRLQLGSTGFALEVGHIPVRSGSRRCHCGNTGCLEVEADPAALLDAAGIRDEAPRLDVARAVIAATGSDPTAREAVERITAHLADGLASLINVLDPDRIVLGGLYADLLGAAGSALRDGVARRSFLDRTAHVELRRAALDRAGLVGAAEIALQPLLDNPRYR